LTKRKAKFFEYRQGRRADMIKIKSAVSDLEGPATVGWTIEEFGTKIP
jgi:hypothetical protein